MAKLVWTQWQAMRYNDAVQVTQMKVQQSVESPTNWQSQWMDREPRSLNHPIQKENNRRRLNGNGEAEDWESEPP